MARFITKIILFLIPVGVVFAFPVGVIMLSKEYYSTSQIAEAQLRDPETVYFMRYTEPGREYKHIMFHQKNPRIITIGASRSVAFRKEFFTDIGQFFNMGYWGVTLPVVDALSQQLPDDPSLQVVFFELDPEELNPNPSPTFVGWYERFYPLFINGWRDIYADYLLGKFSLRSFFEKITDHRIGVNAVAYNTGFRTDGSYEDTRTQNDPDREKNLEKDIDKVVRLLKADRNYIYPSHIAESSMLSLEHILTELERRHVYVVGFLPPLPSKVYNEIHRVSDSSRSMAEEMPRTVGSIFTKHGFRFFDFTDIRNIGGQDTEFIDASHGTDKMALRLMVSMAKQDKKLSSYLNVQQLQAMLESSQGAFLNM